MPLAAFRSPNATSGIAGAGFAKLEFFCVRSGTPKEAALDWMIPKGTMSGTGEFVGELGKWQHPKQRAMGTGRMGAGSES